MKIALVHDWLTTYAGAERILEQFIEMFPDADLFSLVDFLPEKDRHFLQGKKPKTTFIQHLPLARKHFRHYLPLFYTAMRTLDFSKYDLILSSSHCMAKNIKTHKNQAHICYCHSPVRYAWDMQEEYLAESGMGGGLKGFIIRNGMKYVRWVDLKGTPGVTKFIANSKFIKKRIGKCYGIEDSFVVNPHVAINDFAYQEDKQDYYVTASRMVPYKKTPLIAEAFKNMPNKKLIIIGSGTEMPKVEEVSKDCKNIQVLGYQPFSELKHHMMNAKAFIFSAQEDFGITPVEAMACGTPVIAYGKGGVLDSVIPTGESKTPTGLFFKEQTIESICDAVNRFEQLEPSMTPADCRKRAEQFAPKLFQKQIMAILKPYL